ncbi:MAG TPA: efflux RND transporter periplasmic adaptor subunit [Bacilli bacterium]
MFTRWWTGNLSMHPIKPRQLSLLLLCLVVLAASGCGLLPSEDNEEVLPTINPPKLSQKPTYVVKTNTLESKVRGIGKLMSLGEETLFFTLEGKRVKQVFVKTGDTVSPGESIAVLDVEDLEQQIRQKRLQFRKDELQMIEILRKSDEMNADELEQAKIDFELKRTEIVTLQETINKAHLKASFSGTVVSVNIQKGDSVTAYKPVAIVADLSQLTAAATISADDLKKVAVGMEVLVDINAAGKFKGKVKQLPAANNEENPDAYNPNPEAKDTIDKYLVVELDEFPSDMNRGTPLSVTIITGRKENAVVIPLSTLRSFGGRNYVQVIDNNGNKSEVDVEIGQKTSTEVEILKGLKPGQKVVGR